MQPLPRLVLIGSGPTNLLLLEALSRRQTPPRETVLVSSGQTEMSPGTLSGLLAGRYKPSEIGLSLDLLAQAAGARFIQGNVRSVDPQNRSVRLEDGETLLYNAASIATGPYPASSDVPGAMRYGRFLNRLDQAIALVPELETVVREVPEQVARVVVVGSGPEALEIAMTLRQVLDRIAKGKGVVTLIGAAHAVWGERGASARLAEAALRRNDITAILGAQITEVADHRLRLSNGGSVSYDFLVWAAGDQAPDYLTSSGLQVDREGHVIVHDTLQAVDAPALFVAGEVTIKTGDQLTRVGIDPGEGARVIAANLLAALEGRSSARAYHPSRSRLTLAETGSESALLSYGSLGLEARWLMKLKERADRKLIHRLTTLGSR
jgi:selenide,water dikinase